MPLTRLTGTKFISSVEKFMPTLYLIPTTLSDAPLDHVLPQYNSHVIQSVKYFIVENIRTARRFLKLVNKDIDIDSLQFFELNKHTDTKQVASYLKPMREGHDMGVISEAGCPAVADPGADVVAIAQTEGFRICPLVGPSSILLAVMASGFNGQSFAFNGYLPIEKSERSQRIKQLEKRIFAEDQTQIFIETPYRNNQLFDELLKTLQPNTHMCIALNITSAEECIKTKTVSLWKKTSPPDLHKKPCIFLIYK